MSKRAPDRRWSGADSRGVQRLALNRSHSRQLRQSAHPPKAPALWTAEQRALLAQWLRAKAQRRPWETLLKLAGAPRYVPAVDLLDVLLEHGWVVVKEQRDRDRWAAQYLEWVDADGLREALGLGRHDRLAAERTAAKGQPPLDPRLQALYESLSRLPTPSMDRRARIVDALDRWMAQQRSGTRQQFALHALGDTKGLNSGDWQWLAAHLDLEGLQISRHVPAVWLRAPLCLHAGNHRLDLRLVPDLIGLSPLTLERLDAAEGQLEAWLLLENRTSFEQVARGAGPGHGVLWLPGFAPTWWLEAVGRLLRLCPRPAWIAADPDPAGIDIALRAGALWQDHGLPWQPWAMDGTTLDTLTQHKPLNRYDRDRLAALAGETLPAALRDLATALIDQERKGEQEGIDLLSRLP